MLAKYVNRNNQNYLYYAPLKCAASWQNQQNDYAPSEDSDQTGHPASAQSDQSLRCPHEESLGP